MKNKYLLLALFACVPSVNAGAMNLYDCTGKETGKKEGFVSKRQLLIECYGYKRECSVKFDINEFTALLNNNGIYIDTITGADYFRFNEKTGAVQGVTHAPYHYFIGTCKKRLVKPQ